MARIRICFDVRDHNCDGCCFKRLIMGEKTLLFSVTATDCDWSFTRGTGAGGQKKNKTSSAVHCTHRLSGAHAFCQDSRSQVLNRTTAFVRMTQTLRFKTWHQMEIQKRMGITRQIDDYVAEQMKHVVIEQKVDGLWVKV